MIPLFISVLVCIVCLFVCFWWSNEFCVTGLSVAVVYVIILLLKTLYFDLSKKKSEKRKGNIACFLKAKKPKHV